MSKTCGLCGSADCGCGCHYDPDHCAICDNDYADLCSDPQPISAEWAARLRSVRSGPETPIDWNDCA